MAMEVFIVSPDSLQLIVGIMPLINHDTFISMPLRYHPLFPCLIALALAAYLLYISCYHLVHCIIASSLHGY